MTTVTVSQIAYLVAKINNRMGKKKRDYQTIILSFVLLFIALRFN